MLKQILSILKIQRFLFKIIIFQIIWFFIKLKSLFKNNRKIILRKNSLIVSDKYSNFLERIFQANSNSKFEEFVYFKEKYKQKLLQNLSENKKCNRKIICISPSIDPVVFFTILTNRYKCSYIPADFMVKGQSIYETFLYYVQKICCRYAKEIICRDLQLQHHKKRFFKRYKPSIRYYPESFFSIKREQTKKTFKKLSACQIGWFGLEKISKEENGLIDVVKMLLERDFDVHIYLHPDLEIKFKFNQLGLFNDYKKLQRKFKSLYFHKPTTRKKLIPKISTHHFGLSITNGMTTFSKHYTPNTRYAHCLSNRNFDYTQANLLILTSPLLKFNYHVFKNNKNLLKFDEFIISKNLREASETAFLRMPKDLYLRNNNLKNSKIPNLAEILH